MTVTSSIVCIFCFTEDNRTVAAVRELDGDPCCERHYQRELTSTSDMKEEYCNCGKLLHHKGRCRRIKEQSQPITKSTLSRTTNADILSLTTVDLREYQEEYGRKHREHNPLFVQLFDELIKLPSGKAIVLGLAPEGKKATQYRSNISNALNRMAKKSKMEFMVRCQSNEAKHELLIWKADL